jgi:zinc transporter
MTSAERMFEFALLLDGRGGARELSDEEIGNWSVGDGILWVDLDQGNKQAQHWLASESKIDRNIQSILLAGETRPRSLAEPSGLAVILRGINMNPGAVPDDMVAIRIWLEENRIVTSHRRQLLSIRDVRDLLLAGKGPQTVGAFLVAVTTRLTGRIEAAVENVESMLEKLDAQIATGDVAVVRTQLSIVRRQAAAIRRHLAPQRDTLDRLARSGSIILSEKESFELREEGDDLTRQVEDLDLARENALVTQEELMNRVAQEQNSRMYVLSVVAAIFLPLTFVTGVLGMNVAGLPGTINPNGFIVSAVVMVILGFGLVAYFRWRKWF